MDPDDEAFEVSQEALLNTDYDDEATFSPSEDDEDPDELNNLEEDADIPLEQLRAMYGYGLPSVESPAEDEFPSLDSNLLKMGDANLAAAELAEGKVLVHDLAEENSPQLVVPVGDEFSPFAEDGTPLTFVADRSALLSLTHMTGDHDADRLDDNGSSSSDEDYRPAPPSPTLDWRKEIRLGEEYQAEIPHFGSEDNVDWDETRDDDTLMWLPGKVAEDKVSKYLSSALTILNKESSAPATGSIDGRCEWALQHLLRHEHNCDEAIRQLPVWESPVTPWTEEECSNFEHGLRIYGKNFYLIHKYEVSHRSIGELIQFYYLWKKTERHDYFRRTYTLRGRKRTTGPSDFDSGPEGSESDSDSRLASADTESDSQVASAASSIAPSPRPAQQIADVHIAVQSLVRAPPELTTNSSLLTTSERSPVERLSAQRSPAERSATVVGIGNQLINAERSPAVSGDDQFSKRLSPVVLLPEGGALPFVVTCESESLASAENGTEGDRTKNCLSSHDVHSVSLDDHEPQPTPPDSPVEPPCKKLYAG